jgi:hypothetical protein
MNVEVLSQKLSLVCPVSKKRIESPFLFGDCLTKHPYSVCDSESLKDIILVANKRFREYKCPVCSCIPKKQTYFAWWMKAVCSLTPRQYLHVYLKDGLIYLNQNDTAPFINNTLVITPPNVLDDWVKELPDKMKIVSQYINTFEKPVIQQQEKQKQDVIDLDSETTDMYNVLPEKPSEHITVTKPTNDVKPVRLPLILRNNDSPSSVPSSFQNMPKDTAPIRIDDPYYDEDIELQELLFQSATPPVLNFYSSMQSTPGIHPFTHHSQSPTVNSSQYATTTTNTKDTHNVSTKTTAEPEHTRVPLNKPTENPSINVGLNTLRVNTKKNKKDKKSKKEKKTKHLEKDDSRLTVTNSEAANIRYERDIIVKRAGICERRASANPTPGNKELSKFMNNMCDEFKKKFG